MDNAQQNQIEAIYVPIEEDQERTEQLLQLILAQVGEYLPLCIRR